MQKRPLLLKLLNSLKSLFRIKKNLKISTVILSSKKYQYVEDNLFVPKDKQDYKRILIDDTPKKIIEWKAAGGIGILHKSYRQTVKELKKLDIIP